MTTALPAGADVLLTIGWGVLLTAAAGMAAAGVASLWQITRPRMTAHRRARLGLGLIVASVALAWVRPVVVLVPADASSTPARSSVPALVAAAAPPAWEIGVPGLLREDVARKPFVGRVVAAIAVVWLLMAGALLVRLAGGLWMATRIRRRCEPAPADLTSLAVRVGTRLGLHRAVDVLMMDGAGAPFAMGWRQPAVVFPRRTAGALSHTELESLVAHELAHVRRADYMAAILQAALDAVCSLSPGHRRLSDRVRTFREQACDDLAVAVSGDVRTYANALHGVARLGAVAPLAPVVHAADREVAARIRRLLGQDAPPRAPWVRAAGAAALFAVGIAAGATVLSASAMPAAHWAAATDQAPGDAWRAHLERTGIPLGFAPQPDGSPVVLSDVTPSASYVFDTARIRNVSSSRLTSVTFAAVVEWLPAAPAPPRPAVIVEGGITGLTLEPGEELVHALRMLPVEQALALKGKSGGMMQAFLSAVGASTDDAAWSLPIRYGAAAHGEALGLAVPTVPRSMVSSSPPAGPASADCRTDEPDSRTSPGGIVAIRAEPGRFAKCVDGGWVEVDLNQPEGSDLVGLRLELYRGGVLHASPTLKVRNSGTSAISFDDGAVRVAVTPTRVKADSVGLAFVIIADRTITPRLVLRGAEPGSIEWTAPDGTSHTLKVWLSE